MLTPEEKKELQEIEGEISTRMPSNQNKLTPMEQDELRAIDEELSNRKNPQIQKDEEADLGFMVRAKYALEPLESNRKALLTEEFGAENVKEDESGELFLRQGKYFQPVNKDGFSVADVADIAGSTPEILGAGAGAFMGMGAGSVPAAIAGGAAGSVVRQGLSALVGNPQVATVGERVTETALSGGLSGAGAGAGKLAAKGGKAIIPKIMKKFPKLTVSKDGAKILRLSKELNIPNPTAGQLAGGRTLELEKGLGVRRFFGKQIRKKVDSQVEAIKNNLKKEVGEFIDIDSDRALVGSNIKNTTQKIIDQTKKAAGDLFDTVSEQGRDVAIPVKRLKGELLFNFQKMGLFDSGGNALKFNSRTGLSADQFGRVQEIFGGILKDITESGTELAEGVIKKGQKGRYLDATTLNTIRKSIDAEIRDLGKQGVDDVLLIKMRENFVDITEQMLGESSPKLKNQFRQARALWAKQMKMNELFKKGGGKGLGIANLSDEKVLNRAFSAKSSVKQLKELVGSEETEKASLKWVNDMLTQRLGGEDKVTAQAALNILKKNREALIEGMGKQKYQTLRDNLFYLEKIGRPINPSGSGIVQMASMDWKQLAAGALEKVNYSARSKVAKGLGSLEDGVKKLPKRLSQGAAAVTDGAQRDASYLVRNPVMRNPQSEEK